MLLLLLLIIIIFIIFNNDHGDNKIIHTNNNLHLCVDAERMRDLEHAFEKSEFYSKVEEGTRQSLAEALELIGPSVNVNLLSHAEGTEGWTYLHYVVDRYQVSKRNTE